MGKEKLFIKVVLLLIFSIALTNSKAQDPCPFNGPGGTLTNTTPRSYYTGQWWRYNTWDWTQPIYAVHNSSDYYPYNTAPNMGNCLSGVIDSCPFCLCGIASPYTNPETAALALFNSDNAQADGWELIKRDFGYFNNGDINTAPSSPSPYFIMYNRYSGKLRVIATTTQEGAQQMVDIKLHFVTDGYPAELTLADYSTSALFANYG
jgi:hypothetical protein